MQYDPNWEQFVILINLVSAWKLRILPKETNLRCNKIYTYLEGVHLSVKLTVYSLDENVDM